EGPAVARTKSILAPLHELKPGQHADCFVLLSEKAPGTTREGKPFYTCRFSDAGRTVTVMVWADSPRFAECEKDWQEGQFSKVRGAYAESEKSGAQFDLEQIRPAQESDKEDGFDPAQLVERSRFDPEAMFAELRELVEKNVGDEPMRKLVLG